MSPWLRKIAILSVSCVASTATVTAGALVLAPLAGQAGEALAGDPTVDARAHYQEGQRLFAKKDYPAAIREFAAAEKIVPSGYNDYNLGLCYDKLGEAEPALAYYRSYLARVPAASNRSAVEASIARLDAALASARLKAERAAAEKAAAEKAEAERLAAQRAAAEKAAAAEAAEAARLAAEQAAAAQAAATAQAAAAPGPTVPTVGSGAGAGPSVAQVDINAVARERAAAGFTPAGQVAAYSTPNNVYGGPGVASGGVAGPSAAPSAGVPTPAAAAAGARTSDTQAPPPAHATPVYKKWWFWAIVIVGGYLVYDFVSADSATAQPRLMPVGGGPGTAAQSGATLFTF